MSVYAAEAVLYIFWCRVLGNRRASKTERASQWHATRMVQTLRLNAVLVAVTMEIFSFAHHFAVVTQDDVTTVMLLFNRVVLQSEGVNTSAASLFQSIGVASLLIPPASRAS